MFFWCALMITMRRAKLPKPMAVSSKASFAYASTQNRCAAIGSICDGCNDKSERTQRAHVAGLFFYSRGQGIPVLARDASKAYPLRTPMGDSPH